MRLAAGSYFLEVTGWSGDTGPYILEMETPEEVQDVTDSVDDRPWGVSGRNHHVETTRTTIELVLTEETEVLLYSTGSTDTVGELQDDNEDIPLATNDDAFLSSGIRNFLIRRTLAAGTYQPQSDRLLQYRWGLHRPCQGRDHAGKRVNQTPFR